jgi:hypothetical protein
MHWRKPGWPYCLFDDPPEFARWLSELQRPDLTSNEREEIIWALKGDLKGFWAVTVQPNWRVTFRCCGGDVFDVDYVDYH